MLGAALITLLITSAPGSAQSFSGPLVGVELGRQQVIGGSLVDGVDTLQEDMRWVGTLFGGLRLQAARFVFGGEAGIGRFDGSLTLGDPARLLAIDWDGDSQWHWALHAGYAAGARTLLFGYLSEVTRQFDVTVSRPAGSSEQKDEQGLLRFGAGLEQRLAGPFNLRVTAGTSRADFGDRPTNVEIGRRFEIAVGLVLQF